MDAAGREGRGGPGIALLAFHGPPRYHRTHGVSTSTGRADGKGEWALVHLYKHTSGVIMIPHKFLMFEHVCFLPVTCLTLSRACLTGSTWSKYHSRQSAGYFIGRERRWSSLVFGSDHFSTCPEDSTSPRVDFIANLLSGSQASTSTCRGVIAKRKIITSSRRYDSRHAH